MTIGLWSIRRKTVVPAVALGVFVAFMPFPGHPIWATLIGARPAYQHPDLCNNDVHQQPPDDGPDVRRPPTCSASWILGMEATAFDFEMSFDWVTHTLVHIWQPMLLGCFLIGLTAATVAYVVLDLVWRSSLGNYKSRKRSERNGRSV